MSHYNDLYFIMNEIDLYPYNVCRHLGFRHDELPLPCFHFKHYGISLKLLLIYMQTSEYPKLKVSKVIVHRFFLVYCLKLILKLICCMCLTFFILYNQTPTQYTS